MYQGLAGSVNGLAIFGRGKRWGLGVNPGIQVLSAITSRKDSEVKTWMNRIDRI